MQLLPHSCQPIRELRDVGPIQAVYAVGAKHAMLKLDPLALQC